MNRENNKKECVFWMPNLALKHCFLHPKLKSDLKKTNNVHVMRTRVTSIIWMALRCNADEFRYKTLPHSETECGNLAQKLILIQKARKSQRRKTIFRTFFPNFFQSCKLQLTASRQYSWCTKLIRLELCLFIYTLTLAWKGKKNLSVKLVSWQQLLVI